MKGLIVLVADKNMEQAKPTDPKRAMEAALRQARRPRSSAIFLDLASRVSLRGHNEPAFLRLSHALRAWFPPKP